MTPLTDALVLVVEDDEEIGRLVRDLLASDGFSVAVAENGETMGVLLAQQPPDLIILDLMLPGEDGLSICRRLRAAIAAAPPQADQAEGWYRAPGLERLLARYLAALGGRPVTVLRSTPVGRLYRRPLLSLTIPSDLAVHVRLKGGETLIIETTGVLSVSIFGFPPGFWAGIIGIGIALVALAVVRRAVKPLRELARAADQLDLLDEGRPLPDFPRSASEIRALIGAFNRMQARIAGLIRARMAMVGGFSHDVRTYATRLRLRAEKIGDEAERARAVRDLDDMIWLLDDALLAIADQEPAQAEELVDCAALLAEEAADRQMVGAAAELRTALALRRLFSNIIDNALLYGGSASITAERRDGEGQHAVSAHPAVAHDGKLLLATLAAAEAIRHVRQPILVQRTRYKHAGAERCDGGDRSRCACPQGGE